MGTLTFGPLASFHLLTLRQDSNPYLILRLLCRFAHGLTLPDSNTRNPLQNPNRKKHRKR